MSELQDLAAHFSVVCRVEVEEEEVVVECPSYPEHYGEPEKVGCTVAQHEMWKNTEEQLLSASHKTEHSEEWTQRLLQLEVETCKI